MNPVHQTIVVSSAAIPNTAVSQGADQPAQLCGFADPAPLAPQEAQRLALLTPAAAQPARPPIRAEEPTGIRVDIRG